MGEALVLLLDHNSKSVLWAVSGALLALAGFPDGRRAVAAAGGAAGLIDLLERSLPAAGEPETLPRLAGPKSIPRPPPSGTGARSGGRGAPTGRAGNRVRQPPGDGDSQRHSACDSAPGCAAQADTATADIFPRDAVPVISPGEAAEAPEEEKGVLDIEGVGLGSAEGWSADLPLCGLVCKALCNLTAAETGKGSGLGGAQKRSATGRLSGGDANRLAGLLERIDGLGCLDDDLVQHLLENLLGGLEA